MKYLPKLLMGVLMIGLLSSCTTMQASSPRDSSQAYSVIEDPNVNDFANGANSGVVIGLLSSVLLLFAMAG